MQSQGQSNASSRSTSNSLQSLHLFPSAMASHIDRKGASIFGSAEASPNMTWSPFFDGIGSPGASNNFMMKGHEMNAFSALEALQMDELINNDVGSSAASTVSDTLRDPSSSLHNLPAWSTTEDGDDWTKPSPANSDDVVGNDKVVNDVWFAPSALVSRKKRITFNKAALMAEDREISPGAANLKSHKSAPQLVQRVSSADHRAKLEDLLVEMGWPREDSYGGEGGEAVDGHEGDSRQPRSSISGGGGGGAPSSGDGSLASGMPASGALFRRRAQMREGEMPQPSQVSIPATQGTSQTQMQNPATSIPVLRPEQGGLLSYDYLQQHSRSATVPTFHDAMLPTGARLSMATLASSSSISSNLSSVYGQQDAAASNQTPRASLTAREKQEGVARAIQAALNSGLDPRRDSLGVQIPQQTLLQPFSGSPTSAGAMRRPESSVGSGSASSVELRTPVTPFQPMSSSSELSALPSPYVQTPNFSPANAMSTQLLPPFQAAYTAPKMKVMNEYTNPGGGLGNSLGLQYIPALPQSQPPTMIDSSAYAQIFATLPAFQQMQQQQHQMQMQAGLKQMRSSPNLRRSPPSFDGSSPMKTPPIRKIASNRRLAASAAENLGSMPSPTKSPIKKGKSPKISSSSSSNNIPLPPIPSYMTSSSSNPGPTAFEFVNYGIEDADELCSAVAPSGSYKIPLKGFGGSQDDGLDGDDDDGDGDGGGAEGDEAKKTIRRSRSKSSNRLGPRWQGVDDDAGAGDDYDAGDAGLERGGGGDASSPSDSSDRSSSRQLKRIKSEASLAKSSPSRRKSASISNLRRKE